MVPRLISASRSSGFGVCALSQRLLWTETSSAAGATGWDCGSKGLGAMTGPREDDSRVGDDKEEDRKGVATTAVVLERVL